MEQPDSSRAQGSEAYLHSPAVQRMAARLGRSVAFLPLKAAGRRPLPDTPKAVHAAGILLQLPMPEPVDETSKHERSCGILV